MARPPNNIRTPNQSILKPYQQRSPYQISPVLPINQIARPINIQRPPLQRIVDNQLQQRLNQQFGHLINQRPVIPYNTAPQRPPPVPKKPLKLKSKKK